MEAITVTAVLKAKPGMEQQLRGELIRMIGPTRAESGCLEYVLNESIEDPRTFVFYERWESPAAVQSHLDSEHYQEYRRAIEELVESREVYKLQPITP
ncbi:putative quinol monooxygenase [Saccharibacillus kuerlensis]|uniref:Antibiotic biosynthesis monooxygenase n=1 Tax=Saccharibacillus kuerlensis TaxID=459527 RepID=A0ABQ2KV85_9BACL|nr:putative quinol monooxygenase [Saccharibacillus kuerlensis]GGN94371.1 antibiotic biosynthesis monooxygenase [Saccharibacillus kuerlensis]